MASYEVYEIEGGARQTDTVLTVLSMDESPVVGDVLLFSVKDIHESEASVVAGVHAAFVVVQRDMLIGRGLSKTWLFVRRMSRNEYWSRPGT